MVVGRFRAGGWVFYAGAFFVLLFVRYTVGRCSGMLRLARLSFFSGSLRPNRSLSFLPVATTDPPVKAVPCDGGAAEHWDTRYLVSTHMQLEHPDTAVVAKRLQAEVWVSSHRACVGDATKTRAGLAASSRAALLVLDR